MFGDHLLGCSLRIKQHDSLRDIVFHALAIDNVDARREQLCGITNDNRCFLSRFPGGKTSLL